jgi:hypothetical protein
MSERGVFAVDRGIWDHPLLRDRRPFSKREAFLWLVSEAAFKARRVAIGAAVVDVQRGQLAHSLRFMAKAWRWPETNVRRFLDCLKTGAVIGAQSGAGLTVITLCNYEHYQRPVRAGGAPSGAPDGAKVAQDRRRLEKGNKEIEKEAPQAAASPPRKPSRRKSLAPRVYTAEFERAWAAYPKTQTTNPKPEAFDVWERLTPADQEAAAASLPAFSAHCRQQFATYQPPGFGVYLRKRRFDDFAPKPQAAPDPAKQLAGFRAMAVAHFRGAWRETWGPRPGEAGCIIPAEVIADARNEAGRLQ